MHLHRRQMLKTSLAAAFGALLTPRFARAQARDEKLIIVLAYGGWDPVWVFDPKPDAVERVPGDLRRFEQMPIWVHPERPQVTTFFEQWASRTAVLNGMSVQSLAHETCIHMALTGQTRGDRADIGARLAGALGSDKPLPYLALAPHAKTNGYAAITGELGVTNQLMALATREFSWPTVQGDAAMGLVPSGREQAAIDAYLSASTATLEAQAKSVRSQARLADYRSARPRARALIRAARQGGFLSDYDLFQDTSAPWKHVAAAFAEGVSQVALVQPDLYWDTHAYNSLQGQNHDTFFGGLNALMTALGEQGQLDSTTVLVLSEMGRTPRLNAQAGKDHWPWTSAMVVGPRVRGGQVFGETDEWLRPAPINLATGATVADGVELHTEHLLGAVAQMMGLATPGWFEREALHALVG